MAVDENKIASIVKTVLENIEKKGTAQTQIAEGKRGIFSDLDSAVGAAVKAQKKYKQMKKEQRADLIEAVRNISVENSERLAKMAVDITGLGRWQDKKQKIINSATLTPGLEDIKTEVLDGDEGLSLIEKVPVGFVVLIAPTTHPIAQIVNHAICMLAAGNSTFICPHPRAQEVTREIIRLINDAIEKAGGPKNLVVALDKVSLEIVQTVVKHPETDMIMAAGGPSVVEMALTSGKKAIAAGPGNPPVLVDDSADIAQAAKDIINGAVFDNNILCIAEKEIFAVNSIADQLLKELANNDFYILRGEEINKVTDLVVKDPEHVNPDYVGKDAAVILNDAGINVPDNIRGAVMDVDFDHPLVMIEQMLPVLPLVRVNDFAEGLEKSLTAEQHFGHTAMLHSNQLDRIAEFSRKMEVTISVINGPSYAGLDVEGDSNYTHSIAEPTFEGICTPKNYTREIRTSICGGIQFSY
ncbi:aldehyde dehydrogenase [Halanaerobium kushneri]|jgi:propionaldehyde dehydrogenase|uniref:Propionaldehyde dehydrogenase n=1 Tax=Halanaerobium kushneri TaxID=56779 RepID=A0A1N6QTL3_9FIRM|nr:aldehyde dehydrogenase [Halanaerobium kushneri]SIQ19878.1 propionaldehyde dehydrogenase [Halanaerobium kushneri]